MIIQRARDERKNETVNNNTEMVLYEKVAVGIWVNGYNTLN
jgi:hypothetical protein